MITDDSWASPIQAEYFEWMYSIVGDEGDASSHRTLLRCLHAIEFAYSLAMDENRYEDGIALRYRFGRERGYGVDLISEKMGNRPCSVLEMMIALALRCEDDIMSDPDKGDRTGQWFWAMIVNLGLGGETDANFRESRVAARVDRFLRRNYEPDGEGGLFRVEGCDQDMRGVEIWYQMHKYLESINA